MRLLLSLTAFFSIALSSCFAQQTIFGPSVVNLNNTYTYEARNAVSGYPSVDWSANSGTVVATWQSGASYYANIKWLAQGTTSIQLWAGDQYLGNSSSIYIGTLPPANAPGVITGPSLVSVGQTYTYKSTQQGISWGPGSLGTVVSTSMSGGYSYANIKWTAAGTGHLDIYTADDIGEFLGSLQITVGTDYPPTPNASWSPTYYCSSTLITRNSSPESGTDYEWYWQTSATGTSTLLGNGYTTTLTTASPVYLRARLKATPNTWSSQSQFIGNIAVVTPPLPPASAVDGHRISNTSGTVALSVSTVPGATNYLWYTQSIGGTPIPNQTANVCYPSISQPSTNYYVEAVNWLCPSTSRKMVTAFLDPEPVIAATNNGQISMNSPVTLSVSNFNYDTYIWLDGNGNSLATNSTYQTLEPGNYKVRVTKGTSNPVTSQTTTLRKTSLADVNMNYIVTNDMQVEMTDEIQVPNVKVEHNSQTIQYIDGLGRSIQNINTQGSPTKRDFVEPKVYNTSGQEVLRYLPYTSADGTGLYKPNPVGTSYVGSSHYNFYNNGNSDKIADDQKPFAVTSLSGASSNRILKQGGVGLNWQPDGSGYASPSDHSLKYAYESNLASEVLMWTYTQPSVSYPMGLVNATTGTTPNYYSIFQLYKNRTKDESNNEVIEYVNKLGQTVLKKVQSATGQYASTYYVYNDFGNLVAVIPPEATSRLAAEYYQSSATDATKESFLSTWAFRYVYDARKRMILKQVPGTAPTYMIYDDRDRLVLTQDGNQRVGTANSTKYWTFFKYDILNRPILTGIKDTTTSTALTQQQMQDVVDNYYLATKTWRKFGEEYKGETSQNTIHGYSNYSYPQVTSGSSLRSNDYVDVTYYDSYTFQNNWPANYGYVPDTLTSYPYVQPIPAITGITGKKTKVLDGGVRGGDTWLRSVNYYDNKYRLIQTQTDNYKGGIDRVSTQYDFVGRVLKIKNTHTEFDPTWQDLINTSLNGNKLISTSSTAGAASIQQLAAGESGWLEFVVGETNTTRYIGLNDSNPDTNGANIDYAFKLTGSVLNIVENNVTKATISAITPTDVLKIQRIGTSVTYYRNGVLIPLSPTSTPSNTRLIVDVSMNTTDGMIRGVRTSFSTTSKTVLKWFNFDHAGRIIETWHKLNNNTQVRTAYYEYNELGQLVDKKLHSTNATASDNKQSIDYRYNVRGWLTSMNNSQLAIDGGTNDDTNDYFGLNLLYDQSDPNLGNSSLFNGNISAMKWSVGLGQGATRELGYNFGYDAMNRLMAANSRRNKIGAWQSGPYDERISQYDLNGNIKLLQRYSLSTKSDSTRQIDDLNYVYGASGNQLQYIEERITNSSDKPKGFTDSHPGMTTDYTYDANGNLTRDLNKGIGTSISDVSNLINYNFLNLPETIIKGGNKVNNIYDASGRRLTQTVNFGVTQKQTDYAGDFIYENDALQFINFDEGRIIVSGNTLAFINSFDVLDTTILKSNVGIGALAAYASGGENYVKITSGVSNTNCGIRQIGNLLNYQVVPGERYRVRLKGYRSANPVYLQIRTGSNVLTPPGTAMPNGSASESWIEQILTIPPGATTMQIGLVWGPNVNIGESVYLNEVEVSRLIVKSPEYQYHIKDHLGNVRLTFTSTPAEVATDLATLEATPANNRNIEASKFLRYNKLRIVNSSPAFDHTNDNNVTSTNGSSIRLSGVLNERIGLEKTLAVMPGDVIKMEVFAKYVDVSSGNLANVNQALISLINSINTGSATTVTDGSSYLGNDGSTFPWTGQDGTSSSSGVGPKAFLNYMMFDKDFKPILASEDTAQTYFRRMSTIAKENGSNLATNVNGVPHERLGATIRVKQPGYMYIWLSNEETLPTSGIPNLEVYFDDFRVTQTKSVIVSSNDYYPFGLTFNSTNRENSINNKYLFNGGSELQTDMNLGFYSTLFRTYDPAIGRFMQIDPLTDFFSGIAPYAFAIDNPVSYTDPDGLGPILDLWRMMKDAFMSSIGYVKSGSYNSRSTHGNNVTWHEKPSSNSGRSSSATPSRTSADPRPAPPRREPPDFEPSFNESYHPEVAVNRNVPSLQKNDPRPAKKPTRKRDWPVPPKPPIPIPPKPKSDDPLDVEPGGSYTFNAYQFERLKADLYHTPGNDKLIGDLIRVLKSSTGMHLDISGNVFADPAPDDWFHGGQYDFQQKLMSGRGMAIYKALRAAGIPASQLKVSNGVISPSEGNKSATFTLTNH